MSRTQALMLTIIGTSVFLCGIFLLIIADQSTMLMKKPPNDTQLSPTDSDASVKLIEFLIPFHQKVIDQSRLQLAQTKNPDQALFLRKAIDTRVAEISIMKTWYKSWTNTDFTLKTDQNADLAKIDSSSDTQFYKDLYTYNQAGTLRISALQTEATTNTQINTLSKTIITNLSEENSKMNTWKSP